ncbi:hypothetical protein [Salinispira pacifica]
MLSFGYFRDRTRRYAPKTAHAALRGVESGFSPPEAYVFMATSVKPLGEEPVDLDAIEQTLGRGTQGVKTDLLLMRTLERLLHSPEQEVALFAAESINLIEGRYGTRIEKLKERSKEQTQEADLGELARLCQELATLYLPGSSLRAFYLHEAYSWLRELEQRGWMTGEARSRMVRVLLALGLYDQARAELESFGVGRNTEALLLEAQIEFERRNYAQVTNVCRTLASKRETLSEEERQCVDYWLEQDE